MFLSACVQYDPPETELLVFSAYSDPQPLPIIAESRHSDPDLDSFPRMVAPPIAMLFDTDAEVEVERRLYERAIQEIGKRYLEPLGIDIHSMLYDVLEDGLEDEYHEKLSRIKARPYIEVDEYTTEEDVKKARRAIRATLSGRSKGGATSRDPLIAVDCAILRDRYNWSFKQLAERHGWNINSKDRIRDHIAEGREILARDLG